MRRRSGAPSLMRSVMPQTDTSALVYRSWTKGTQGESGPPRYSGNWVVARRAWFKVFSDRVECGDWIIPTSSVTDAVLFEARQWFMPVYILTVSTSSGSWQFGFNPWSRVASCLPFPFRRERVRLAYSKSSVLVRVLLLALVGYWLWQRFAA